MRVDLKGLQPNEAVADWAYQLPFIMWEYTYKVIWSEEDGEYVGLCAEFPSLSWLADTQKAALQGIRDVVVDDD